MKRITVVCTLGMVILQASAQQPKPKVGLAPLPKICGPNHDEQCVPGGGPPQSADVKDIKVPLKLEDKADVLQLQKDVQNSELAAFQISQQLDTANKGTQTKGAVLDKKINALRKAYGLPDDTPFDPDTLTFTKPSEKK